MKRIFVISVCLFLLAAPFYAAPAQTVLVAGFQNLGGHADDNLNIVLTKSLISYLSKLTDVNVVSYETAEQTAEANGFWKTNAVNLDTVDMMGLSLHVKKVVFGNYRVNSANNTIAVSYSIYDTHDGEVTVTRKLDGPAGIDVFDTIDEMARKVTVVVAGRNVDFAALSTPAVVTNRTVVTNGSPSRTPAPAPAPAPRFSVLNIVILPVAIAGTLGGGIYESLSYQNNLNAYNDYLTIYNDTPTFENYANLTNSQPNYTSSVVLQSVLYGTSGILTGLELYLLLKKPQTLESFRWIAVPGYVGFYYQF